MESLPHHVVELILERLTVKSLMNKHAAISCSFMLFREIISAAYIHNMINNSLSTTSLLVLSYARAFNGFIYLVTCRIPESIERKHDLIIVS